MKQKEKEGWELATYSKLSHSLHRLTLVTERGVCVSVRVCLCGLQRVNAGESKLSTPLGLIQLEVLSRWNGSNMSVQSWKWEPTF